MLGFAELQSNPYLLFPWYYFLAILRKMETKQPTAKTPDEFEYSKIHRKVSDSFLSNEKRVRGHIDSSLEILPRLFNWPR